ncbi:hypothetical protein Rhsp01_43560 [Rhizobium sp. NBRC 114257]|uniref:Uncharacterized protein n=1 Tax=Rhizobium dioscoreae TaxID=2653122 RepID=A0ABQ0Z9W3_9HYPH|nr:hypothetical protein RsS93_47150 [Rhizobium dioscoreae]GLU83180.1 hypothetical protein Rhsp01_43560 [Rhizobium sp. NBRC 114257]
MNIDKGDIDVGSHPGRILSIADRPRNVIAGRAQDIFHINGDQGFIFNHKNSHGGPEEALVHLAGHHWSGRRRRF